MLLSKAEQEEAESDMEILIRSLRERPVLHTGCVKPGKMRGYVLDLLEGKT